MPTFTNQAHLTYNTTTVNSNIAVGTILSGLTVTKNAVSDEYQSDSTITYVVSIHNQSNTTLSNVTLTDDLGSYAFGSQTLYPLTYVLGSVQMYENGTLVPPPTVTLATTSLVMEGISVPQNGNTFIVYSAHTNPFTPLGEGASVTNTVTVTAPTISCSATDSETVYAASEPLLTVNKTISPNPVECDGTLTYTVTMQNFGGAPVGEDENTKLTDSFDPILHNLSVTFNGASWVEGVDYTYCERIGLFQSVSGKLTVPAATFSQNEESGEWTVTPGVSVIVITGTLQGSCCK